MQVMPGHYVTVGGLKACVLRIKIIALEWFAVGYMVDGRGTVHMAQWALDGRCITHPNKLLDLEHRQCMT